MSPPLPFVPPVAVTPPLAVSPVPPVPMTPPLPFAPPVAVTPPLAVSPLPPLPEPFAPPVAAVVLPLPSSPAGARQPPRKSPDRQRVMTQLDTRTCWGARRGIENA